MRKTPIPGGRMRSPTLGGGLPLKGSPIPQEGRQLARQKITLRQEEGGVVARDGSRAELVTFSEGGNSERGSEGGARRSAGWGAAPVARETVRPAPFTLSL